MPAPSSHPEAAAALDAAIPGAILQQQSNGDWCVYVRNPARDYNGCRAWKRLPGRGQPTPMGAVDAAIARKR